MKKFFLFGFAFLFIAASVSAQNAFVKGSKVINLGIGLGSGYYSGSGYTNKIPPVSASFEVGVKDNLFDEKSSLGIGGYLGYTGAKWEYEGWGYKYSDIIVGARGILHYQFVEKLDTYTGIMIGYDIYSAKEFGTSNGYDYYSSSNSGLTWSWFAGGRYYFNEKFAGMLELGYGISYLNLGISIKL